MINIGQITKLETSFIHTKITVEEPGVGEPSVLVVPPEVAKDLKLGQSLTIRFVSLVTEEQAKAALDSATAHNLRLEPALSSLEARKEEQAKAALEPHGCQIAGCVGRKEVE